MAATFGWSPKVRGWAVISFSPCLELGMDWGKPMVHVLLAEDNPGDVLLIREALQEGGFEFELTVQQDGEKMLSYIDLIDAGEKRCPDIVLLDLNLPKRNGDVLLKRMRSGGSCRDVPVIIVTSSDSKRDRDMAA